VVTEKSDKLHETLNFYRDMYDKDVVFTTAWGYSGMVLLDHARSVWARVPVVSVNTGMLFQETVDFANLVHKQWNLDLSWVGPIDSFRSPPTQECCEERKVLPLQYMLKPYQAWVSALRHDQASTRANSKEVETDRWGMIRLAPMLSWTSEECWKYIRDNDVPVQPLHAQGYRSIGCKPCTRLPVTDDERSGRWAGERLECGIHRMKP
jgi:phosphoadenosine phosphosulfate reductase